MTGHDENIKGALLDVEMEIGRQLDRYGDQSRLDPIFWIPILIEEKRRGRPRILTRPVRTRRRHRMTIEENPSFRDKDEKRWEIRPADTDSYWCEHKLCNRPADYELLVIDDIQAWTALCQEHAEEQSGLTLAPQPRKGEPQ